ncbi:hypothetical protein BpHYR1_032012 [Brachionus plicatilis]|uniref:Uncharacterized protein n=1 Tax=Brachionus plicatilis TaxID=10195 RepID=A0A3M7T1K0_BRAPC|nr:hypothetical protein BpHYR1_032012 [Brachionus plicatilis]
MSDLNLTNSTNSTLTVFSLSTNLMLNKSTKYPVIFPDFKNSFLSFDNKAKEIILLSTAFATMLLSMCFLIFIAWFCCATIYKERPVSCKKISKSVNESRNNIQLNRSKKSDHIYVRDGSECTAKKDKTTKPSDDTISYHAYDILDMSSKSSPDPEKIKKEKFKQKLNSQLSKGNLNPGFVNDEAKRYISLNKPSRGCGKMSIGRVSKNSTLRNRPKLTRQQIEREFYEYTLDCRQKLNDLFSTTSSETKDSDEEKLKNDYNSLKSKFKRPCLSACTKKNKNFQQIWQI